ncbi:MAG: relaxase/mobilization nuclease domain-containing protein [Rhizobiales bacterium]|nr:relaxase/mobilization nuclease domain-containing protein [Hyphomicrobiales bacterium]
MAKTSQAQQLVQRIMGRPYGEYEYHGSGAGGSNRVGSSRIARQTRAAQGRPSAVFKFVRNGSCTDRSSLGRQLEYVGTKSDAIIDPSHRYSDQARLDKNDINRITRKWELSWGDNWRTGNLTNHFVMSFPPGTDPNAVENIVTGVCNEMLSSGDRTFEYVAGVHTDEDHPHAHLIINRVGSDGSLFLMRQGTEFSYESFKEAIVAHGERHGVYLDASTRFERGLIHRPPTTKQVYETKYNGHEPEDRKRVLKEDLEFALGEIKKAQKSYENITEYCADNNLMVLSVSTRQAAITLENHQPLTNNFPITAEHTNQINGLDQLVEQYNTDMLDLQDRIAIVSVHERPALQSKFADILKQSHPILDEGDNLNVAIERQSKTGIYNSDKLSVASDEKQALIEVITSVVDGYGLDSSELAERFTLGNNNKFLENVWMRQDFDTIARAQELDLNKPSDFETARKKIDTVYDSIEDTLVSHGWYQNGVSNKIETGLDAQQAVQEKFGEILQEAVQLTTQLAQQTLEQNQVETKLETPSKTHQLDDDYGDAL